MKKYFLYCAVAILAIFALFSVSTNNTFKKFVESVENKNIAPIKIAKKAYKILNTKRAKFVYNVNRNFLLRLLNILPKRLQLFIIKRILIDK